VTNLVEAPTPTNIVFGTDGWRARVADDFTFDNVRRCADGVAQLRRGPRRTGKGVVIAYDRRFASEHFARAAARSSPRTTSPSRSRSPPCPRR
jgi:phosphomannomutase